ncbi:MAG: hypothetical protein GEU89_21390, partial [Kiloniellaceae bacterium]|nr:hypothetical protein [Kiloniellaceae bacterium]
MNYAVGDDVQVLLDRAVPAKVVSAFAHGNGDTVELHIDVRLIIDESCVNPAPRPVDEDDLLAKILADGHELPEPEDV